MKSLHTVAFVLLVIGGLNWGLVGAFDFNLVEWLVGLFGELPTVVNVIYILVGLAAITEVATHKSLCKMCVGSSGSSM